jgi:hypothetical protein
MRRRHLFWSVTSGRTVLAWGPSYFSPLAQIPHPWVMAGRIIAVYRVLALAKVRPQVETTRRESVSS